MAEVSNELIYSVLKSLELDLYILKGAARRIDARIAAIEQQIAGVDRERYWQNGERDQMNVYMDEKDNNREGEEPGN